jgi:hypothetical protein
MRLNKTFLFFAFLYAYTNVCAQLSTREQPISFNPELKLKVSLKNSAESVTTPLLDMAKIEAEDKEDEKADVPPRFGYPHYVNYNLNNSGIWYDLPDGGKLWQLDVVCPGALSVNFCYDKFWIPEGGKFFIYTKDKKQSIGAFTCMNNKGDRYNIRGFATELLFSDDVVLEYYQPKEVTDDAIISINRIIHGYRSIRDDEGGFGHSGECEVNVNCSEGQNWQNEKKAVALIIIKGLRSSTGALVNSTDMGLQPFFLTGNHCLKTDPITDIKPDAEGQSELDDYVFYWNYEVSGCNNTVIDTIPYTTQGATVLANYDDSDFALLLLEDDPKTLSNYVPYYLGWDYSIMPGTPGVCIHHPYGDVKKISTVAYQPETTSYNNCNAYWAVNWKATPHGHGITEDGSSGSPLLNGEHRLIGQLRRGNSYCGNPYATDLFGRFNFSWTNGNHSSIHRRLDYWLNPIGSEIQALDGLLYIPSSKTINVNDSLHSNIRITSNGQLTVQSNVVLIGNGKVIVDAGGKLIIDGGRLSDVDILLKPGATLQIKNGGIIECQDDFIAPVGAIVDIENGQIL